MECWQAYENVRIVHINGAAGLMDTISNVVGSEIEELVPDTVMEIASSTPSGSGCSLPQSNPANWGLDRIDQVNLPLDLVYDPDGGCNMAQTSIDAYVLDSGSHHPGGGLG